MWLLVRHDPAAPQERVLAACPDSDDRGEVWRWSVNRTPNGDSWQARVQWDPAGIVAQVSHHAAPEPVELERAAGEEVVLVAEAGESLVALRTGDWRRRLSDGDVFVLEGDQAEHIRIIPSPPDARVTVARLRATDGPLRWVP
jgi:hypothetical protein